MGVARFCGFAAKHGGYNMLAISLHGCHEIKAGGAYVTGLDTIDAFYTTQKRVVIAVAFAGIFEAAKFED